MEVIPKRIKSRSPKFSIKSTEMPIDTKAGVRDAIPMHRKNRDVCIYVVVCCVYVCVCIYMCDATRLMANSKFLSACPNANP